MKVLSVFLSSIALIEVYGRPGYRNAIPNGFNVVHDVFDEEGNLISSTPWTGVGHNDPAGGGPRNPFGLDADATRQNGQGDPVWQLFCNEDSDDDGLSNGFELGDPDCLWEDSSDNGILRTVDITHPGFSNLSAVGTPTEVQLHAALMIIAWAFCAPLGIFFAAFFKVKSKPKQKVFGYHWFPIHRALLLTTVVLTYIAYIIILAFRKIVLFNSGHTVLGHLILIAAAVQVTGGFLRVHIEKDGSKSDKRIAWEYFHQWLGRSILISALVNIFLGLDLVGTIAEGVRNGMQTFIIVWLIALGLASMSWAIFRVDERQLPVLPVKGEKKKEEYVIKAAPVEDDKVDKVEAKAAAEDKAEAEGKDMTEETQEKKDDEDTPPKVTNELAPASDGDLTHAL